MLPVYEDDCFLVEQCSDFFLPGYLVIRVKSPCDHLATLDKVVAQKLMTLIQQAYQVVEAVVQPEKIYCCSFCEVNTQLHYHIFPRTKDLTIQYQQANQLPEDQPIDGPKLLVWARGSYQLAATPAEKEGLFLALKTKFIEIQ